MVSIGRQRFVYGTGDRHFDDGPCGGLAVLGVVVCTLDVLRHRADMDCAAVLRSRLVIAGENRSHPRMDYSRLAAEKGMKEGKLETAKELIKRGVDINIITEATGISREEIEKLASTIH